MEPASVSSPTKESNFESKEPQVAIPINPMYPASHGIETEGNRTMNQDDRSSHIITSEHADVMS